MKNNEQQSILVDQEFCDQNIFTYYQRSNQIHPKIRLFALQKNKIQSQLNGNVNHSQIQYSMNIISIFYEPKCNQSASLPKQSFTNRENFQRKQNKIKSLSTETSQLKPKFKPLQGISAKIKLIQQNQKKNLLTQNKVYETPVYEDCSKHYTEQKPQTFRYKDLELNSYIEEYKLLKQQTIPTVILPNVFQHQSRNDNSQSSRLSIQGYQHSFKAKINTRSISQNKQIQQKNFNISGWSDHSNK